jgi:predicted phosphodiesterase
MDIHILSDLHTEKCSFGAAAVLADCLVLAGDIGDASSFGALAVAEGYLSAGKHVFYVPGNHEFYGSRAPQQLRKLGRLCRKHAIHLLANREVIVGDVRFLGAPLWTDFELNGTEGKLAAQKLARQTMADYTWIFDGKGTCLEPMATARWHARSVHWLRARLADSFSGRTVVVSHHGVHPRSIHPRFEGDLGNGAFVSNLEALILEVGPDLWLHGHVHQNVDYRVGRTRVVTNPRGYAKRVREPDGTLVERRENPAFNPKLVLTV